MGKQTKEPQLERWRYAMLFRVTVSGEEPVIVPAYDEADAVEQAAEELGMDPWLCRKLGAEVTVPQAQEMLRYARNKRRTLKMRVECEGYAPHECRAYCRMDAVLDAANAWGADYMQIKDKARVGVSARLPE